MRRRLVQGRLDSRSSPTHRRLSAGACPSARRATGNVRPVDSPRVRCGSDARRAGNRGFCRRGRVAVTLDPASIEWVVSAAGLKTRRCAVVAIAPNDHSPETTDEGACRAFSTQREAVDVVGTVGGSVEAANADTAAMSWTDMLVTIDFISSDHGPRRAPVFISKSCRMV